MPATRQHFRRNFWPANAKKHANGVYPKREETRLTGRIPGSPASLSDHISWWSSGHWFFFKCVWKKMLSCPVLTRMLCVVPLLLLHYQGGSLPDGPAQGLFLLKRSSSSFLFWGRALGFYKAPRDNLTLTDHIKIHLYQIELKLCRSTLHPSYRQSWQIYHIRS